MSEPPAPTAAKGLSAPQTADALRDLILARYDGFSKRLQHVARYVLDHPDDVALETLTVIAERSGAQPSAIVRFAKAIGFPGASPMQRILRDSLLANHSTLGYGERIRHFNATLDAKGAGGVGALLEEFSEGDIIALQNLRQTIGAEELANAVALIAGADTLYIIGMRRAFPVAAYLAYSFLRVGKKSVFMDNVGGLAAHQMRTVSSKDLLIAISYHPYAPETVEAVDAAVKSDAKVLAITDSFISPLAKGAAQVLQVRESQVRAFRSLSASICLAQTLVIGLAYEQERAGATGGPRGKKA
jgi:DNA-binding MurR/RpiR family transcriptional regulator